MLEILSMDGQSQIKSRGGSGAVTIVTFSLASSEGVHPK
jgi:hypothetical protein